MSSELIRLAGSNGGAIVGAETFSVPSGKLIYSAWVRVACQITAFKEIIALGDKEKEIEVTKTLNSEDSNIDEDLIVGEYITFDDPLSEITCDTAGGLRVYYITR